MGMIIVAFLDAVQTCKSVSLFHRISGPRIRVGIFPIKVTDMKVTKEIGHILLSMKRQEILFSILFPLAYIIWIIVFLVPRTRPTSTEFIYLLFIVIPFGLLWLRAFARNHGGN